MADAKVRMIDNRLRKVAGVQFRPGLQRVPSEGWTAVKKHPIGKRLIDCGILEEVKAKSSKPPTASELVAEIRETYDVETLRGYAGDSRKTVSTAAQEQIDKINAQGSSESGDNSEG